MLERQSGNSFDLLSLLFLMVLMLGYQSLIMSVPVIKLLYFTYLHYMIIFKMAINCTLNIICFSPSPPLV